MSTFEEKPFVAAPKTESEASVTKKNEPKKMAVALGGTGGVASNIPKILASGRGDMAQKLLDWADEQGLVIERNSDLAQVLSSLNLGDAVPEEVFMAVAEILYYVYEVNSDIKNAKRS